jgi:hypothetical protein
MRRYVPPSSFGKLGKSVGFIPPKEMPAHLRAKEGHTILTVEIPTGYAITTPGLGVHSAGHFRNQKNSRHFSRLGARTSNGDPKMHFFGALPAKCKPICAPRFLISGSMPMI